MTQGQVSAKPRTFHKNTGTHGTQTTSQKRSMTLGGGIALP